MARVVRRDASSGGMQHDGLPAALPGTARCSPRSALQGCLQGAGWAMLARPWRGPGCCCRYFNSAGSNSSFSLSRELAAAAVPPPRAHSVAPGLSQSESPRAGARERGLILGSHETGDGSLKTEVKREKQPVVAHFLQPAHTVKKPLTFQVPAYSCNCTYF